LKKGCLENFRVKSERKTSALVMGKYCLKAAFAFADLY